MGFYILGVVICLAVALAGVVALRWATRMSSRLEQLEAERGNRSLSSRLEQLEQEKGNRSPMFLGVGQVQFDALKKVVGANETAFGGNIRLLLGDRDELARKVAKLEEGLVSVANEVADLGDEKTAVSTSSGQSLARDLPFAT